MLQVDSAQRKHSLWKTSLPTAVFSAAYTVLEHTSHFSPPPPPKADGFATRGAAASAADARELRASSSDFLCSSISVNGFDIDERPASSGMGTPPFPLESGGAT